MPVTICFFLSGAAALILQVLWTRMLGHVFGATTLAVSTTLTAFMGGLALGSHFGGKYATKLKRPLLAFAVLESAVGFYGLLVPALFSLLPVLQRAIGIDLQTGVLGYSVLRFVIVSLILLLPTTAMGATLPFLAEGIVSADHHMASRTGRLYAANTFGAVFGAFFAGFVLIPELGITKTVYLAATIDLFVAAVVVVLWKVSGSDEILTKTRGEETPDEILTRLEPTELVGIDRRAQKLTLFVFAASGAAAMALEVLGARSIGVVIGASTYSFTLILVTFLVGLALGAAIISRRIDMIRDPILVLAWVEVGIGLMAIVGSLLVDRLPSLIHSTARAHDVTMTAVYFTNFIVAALVMFPTTILLGAVFPLVVRILSPGGAEKAGSVVGRAYAVNTLGAIIGSFAAGFLLIPFIGVERGFALAAGISLVLGLSLALVRRRGVFPVLATVLAGLVFIFFGPRWNVQSWTSGLFRMHIARNIYPDGWTPSGELVFHKDGISTTVTVERESDGIGVSLKVNGKVDASDIGDMPTQVLSGLLPIIMHDRPERVLVIGYGSGVTPGAVLQSEVKSVHLAELESAVYEAANAHFAHVNHQPSKDPRFTAVIDDGRNFLLTRNETFDVIISEPSNPWMSGAASLFTVDFFEIARRRLDQHGIFLQWLQLYELSPEHIHALIRTFHTVFPNVLVFSPDPFSNDTLLLGSAHPIRVDRARLQRYFMDGRTKDELLRANVTAPEDLLGLFLLGSDEVEKFVGKGPLNTDDNAMIEYGAPKDLITYATKDARLPFVEAIDGKRLETAPHYFDGFDFNDGPTLLIMADRLLRQGQLSDAEMFLKRAREKQADTSTPDQLLDLLTEADSQPVVVITDQTRNDERYARVVLTMTEKNDREALTMFEREKDLEEASLAHRFLYAYLCYRRERTIDAEYLMEKVLADDAFVRAHPNALYYGGRIFADRGKYGEGVKMLERYLTLTATVTSTSTHGRP